MTEVATNSAPDALEFIKQDCFQKIENLQALLLKQDPALPGHLKAIHGTLNKYEELTHLLTDEQIRKMIVAQKQVTGTVLIAAVTKSKSTASLTKQAKGISAADL